MFDPRRVGVLLIGGDKTGNDRFYDKMPAIAKLEKRTDMYISTLRSHINAMGGDLEIIASFPDGDVKISNFSQI